MKAKLLQPSSEGALQRRRLIRLVRLPDLEGAKRMAEIAYLCGALSVSRDPSSQSIGPRAHISGFLEGLRRNGYEANVYLAGEDNTIPKALRAGSAGSHGSPGHRQATARDLARLSVAQYAGWRARRHIRPSAALVYERHATFQQIGLRRTDHSVPWVVESNGPFWYEASRERSNLRLIRTAKKMELECYRQADLVVAVSDSLRDLIAAEARLPPDKIVVLPNATDPERFRPQHAIKDRSRRHLVVGFVGYVAEWAGLDVLFRAVRELDPTGETLRIVVVGHGPARPGLEQLSSSLGIEAAVEWTGSVPWHEVPQQMARFDLAYSGQVEMEVGSMYHSPQKLYEYQSMGLPILASDFADARTLISSGGWGWLFRPGDVTELANRLSQAGGELPNPDLSASCRASIVKNHSWESRVADLLKVLRSTSLL
ncbi:glycosyltransferase family 4 protein [Actinomycetospora sp. OC33-EN08]|uniref:Glycosyltransferase family 4 protein n=1 Tax=Actinomycetospora aurantiaca TaxID=3129233 RepID=A0ABU8MGF1_9PSEU